MSYIEWEAATTLGPIPENVAEAVVMDDASDRPFIPLEVRVRALTRFVGITISVTGRAIRKDGTVGSAIRYAWFHLGGDEDRAARMHTPSIDTAPEAVRTAALELIAEARSSILASFDVVSAELVGVHALGLVLDRWGSRDTAAEQVER